MAGLRAMNDDPTDPSSEDPGKVRKAAAGDKKNVLKIPKGTKRAKRKKKVTFNSPRTEKISYG